MTSPPFKKLKPWHLMLKRGELKEVTLQPGSFLSDSEIKDKYNHKYYPYPERLTTEISESTILWYEKGAHKECPQYVNEEGEIEEYPHVLYGGEEREIAGIFLKNVIPQDVQDKAFAALEKMKWHGPSREETKTAVARQRGKIDPKELTIGVVRPRHKAVVMPSRDTKKNHEQLLSLVPLWEIIAACFSRVLPNYFGLHNSPRTHAGPLPDFGGIPDYLRQWFMPVNATTPFSTVTLLRSCPASIHKDRNARKDQHNFACLTSLGSDFKGGRFCLIEYGMKVPVRPGDLFIAQTTREWHYNVDPVIGVKYSIICYYQRRLANPKLQREGLGAAGGDSL